MECAISNPPKYWLCCDQIFSQINTRWSSLKLSQGGAREYRPPYLLGCYVTEYAPHKALNLIALVKLTFDERVVLHRAVAGEEALARAPRPRIHCHRGLSPSNFFEFSDRGELNVLFRPAFLLLFSLRIHNSWRDLIPTACCHLHSREHPVPLTPDPTRSGRKLGVEVQLLVVEAQLQEKGLFKL